MTENRILIFLLVGNGLQIILSVYNTVGQAPLEVENGGNECSRGLRQKRQIDSDKVFIELDRIYAKIEDSAAESKLMIGDFIRSGNNITENMIIKFGTMESRQLATEEHLRVTQSNLENTNAKLEKISTTLGGTDSKITLLVEKFEKFVFNQTLKTAGIPRSNRIADGPSECLLWPDGNVHYEITASISNPTRITIANAIKDFHDKTCIRWIPRTTEGAFVSFINEDSSLTNKTEECYTGGRRIAIVRDEFSMKDVIRQMAYILGFGDEHLRNDRDKHIEVRRNNCTMEKKYPHLNGGGFYTYRSIMHPSCDHTSCLQIKNEPGWSCVIPNSLGVTDVEKLNEMYNCKGCHSLRFQFPNQLGFQESELVPVFANSRLNSNYICRVFYEGFVIIGRGNVKTGECHFWHNRRNVGTANVQFLTNPQQTNIQWVRRKSDFPINAIPGGFYSDERSLYISRCTDEPQWGEAAAPGKIYNGTTTMVVYKSGETTYNTCSSFDLLTCS